MKKFYKFLKSFLFISLWLTLSSFLTQYWNTFHWEYIYLNFRILFDKEFQKEMDDFFDYIDYEVLGRKKPEPEPVKMTDEEADYLEQKAEIHYGI